MVQVLSLTTTEKNLLGEYALPFTLRSASNAYSWISGKGIESLIANQECRRLHGSNEKGATQAPRVRSSIAVTLCVPLCAVGTYS